MKKILIVVLSLLILGGAGYFLVGKFNKTEEAAATGLTEEETKTEETINLEEAMEVQTDVPLDKIWEYKFEPALDEQSLTDENIYVMDEEKTKVKVSYELSDGGRSLLITPPSDGYNKGTRYELHITDDVKKVTGENVSHSYEMHFITIRDEVEEGVLNPDIKKLKKEQFEFTGEDVLKIDKDVDLAKDDIIIIPTKDYPDGQALKITKVDSEVGSYIVNVEEPEFDEIYKDLDVNKTYPITEDNITLNENVEGVTIESLASLPPSTMVASASAGKKENAEFVKTPNGISVDLSKGLQLKFSEFPLGKNPLGIDGTVTMFSPEVHTDISPLGILHRFKLATTGKIESDLKVSAIKETDDDDLPIDDSFKIAKLKIPTSVPGLMIEGNLMIRFNYTLESGLETTLYMTYEDVSGFVYEHNKVDTTYKTQEAEFNIGLKGSGKADGQIGPAADIMLTGFGVVGGGLEAFTGASLSGEAIAGVDPKFGKYACAKLEESLFMQGSAKMNVLGKTVARWVFGEAHFGTEQKSDSCRFIDGFVPIKDQTMDAGEEKVLKLQVNEQDLLEKENKIVQANMKDVEVSASVANVVDVKKTKKGISITALELPKKEKTTITITKMIDGRENTIIFPVIISNYKEVKEKAKQEEAKKKEEEKKKELASIGWNGEWKRVLGPNSGTLNISNYDGETFDLNIEVTSGSHTGSTEGTATASGKSATFTDSESKCQLDLTLNDESIQVDETQECSQLGGIGTFFSGEYNNTEAAASTPASTLSSLGILEEKSDADIQSILGNDYADLVENMQLVSEASDKYGLEDTMVIEGAVRGMYTLMEGIIVKDPFNNYYIGNLISNPDGSTVLRFYTNDENYKDKLHGVVDTWRQSFSEYPVEYVYRK